MRVKVVVFESCLQRPKYVIFEGLNEEGLVMVVENDEEDEEEEEENCRETLENLWARERMRYCKNEVNVCVLAMSFKWVGWRCFACFFVLIND